MYYILHRGTRYTMAFKIKPGHDTVTKTFRLPTDICDSLEQLAYDNNLSLNAVIVQCLEYALQDISTDASAESDKE